MKRNHNVCLILGIVLIVCGLGAILLLRTHTRQADQTNRQIVQTMEGLLTDRRSGTKDPDREPEMPALEIQGEDYIGLLEIPAYGLKLPVCGVWEKGNVVFRPCRFYGSAYNGTLIVGGYDQPGQFDFLDRIDIGAAITLTDMTGCTFSYLVERIERSGSAEAEVLLDDRADLTLFVRDAQLLEYIILRCTMGTPR